MTSEISNATPVISVRDLTKRFGEQAVLTGVDLDITAGETHVILGRSGSGKSVLLKIICGLLGADRGSLLINGERVESNGQSRSARRARAKIQMLFQGAALFDSLTVAQNVAFHAIEHGQVRPAQVEEFAQPHLETVDLARAGPLMPAELSGGMKKRVALARALAARPEIMLYDEPTTGLDPITCQVINSLIRQTQQRLGVTSVVVTHDLRSAREVGDRCSFLDEGQIIETTPVAQLGASDHPVICSFIDGAVVSFPERDARLARVP